MFSDNFKIYYINSVTSCIMYTSATEYICAWIRVCANQSMLIHTHYQHNVYLTNAVALLNFSVMIVLMRVTWQ